MKAWENLSLRWKLMILGLFGVFLLGGGSIISFIRANAKVQAVTSESLIKNLRDGIEASLVEKTDVAFGIVRYYYERAERGEMAKEDAQNAAKNMIREIRFGKLNDYFWIHTYDSDQPKKPVMVMHPTLPQLDGTELLSFIDKERFANIVYLGRTYQNKDKELQHIQPTNLFVDMNSIIHEQKSGTLRYYWSKPGKASDTAYSKMSYVKLFEPWGWVIGTGAYDDEVEATAAVTEDRIDTENERALEEVLVVFGAVLLAACFFSFVLIRGISKILNALGSEAKRLTEAAIAGQLEIRGDPQLVSWEFRPIIAGVNQLLDAVIAPLNVAAEYIDRISKGDIPEKITDEYNGDFNEIKNNLNMCIDALNGLSDEMNHMSSQHDLGEIDVNINVNAFHGSYKKMAEGINNMVNGHIAVKKKAMACVGEFGRGNFEAPLEKFPGKKAFINDTIEKVRENLKALIADTGELVDAAVEGQLKTRADATRHEGDFRKIVEGINKTLDAVVGPINEAAEVLERVANQDLTAEVKGDYKGDLALIKNNINRMTADLRENMKRIAASSQGLGASSTELSQVSVQMAGNSEEASTQANVVSAASEQVSKNVTVVSSSAEEMLASIREIARSAGDAAKIAKNAVSVADNTNTTVSKLGDSSAEIGNVVKLITAIAQQTNLLALNATIEAARAGEAGKGFAVVANEVKELAKETAKATEEISQKIDVIQTDTQSAVGAIGEITNVIQNINDISNVIATAVEEQTATTGEMVRNLGEAASGTGEIAKNITGVANAAKDSSQGASQVQVTAKEVSEMAVQLQDMVGRFQL